MFNDHCVAIKFNFKTKYFDLVVLYIYFKCVA